MLSCLANWIYGCFKKPQTHCKVKVSSIMCWKKMATALWQQRLNIFICIIYFLFGVLSMSCLLFILSRVQNFSMGTCLFWYLLYEEKNILLVNVRVLGEIVALQGTVWEAALHELTFWLDFDKTQPLVLFIKKTFQWEPRLVDEVDFFMEILLIYSVITMQRMFTGSFFSTQGEQDGLEFPAVSRNHAHKAEKGSVPSVALGRPC